jgi:hypothetical protein
MRKRPMSANQGHPPRRMPGADSWRDAVHRSRSLVEDGYVAAAFQVGAFAGGTLQGIAKLSDTPCKVISGVSY